MGVIEGSLADNEIVSFWCSALAFTRALKLATSTACGFDDIVTFGGTFLGDSGVKSGVLKVTFGSVNARIFVFSSAFGDGATVSGFANEFLRAGFDCGDAILTCIGISAGFD